MASSSERAPPLARLRCRPLRLLLLAVLVMELLLVDRMAHALQVNAWSPCPAQTTEHRSSMAQVTECTTAVVPLCYADFCGSSDSGEAITLFLKRIPANSTSTRPRNVWMIPDRSDVVLPSEANDQIETLYRQLGGEVSVYTLDQRGTGQSSRLACNVSSSSPSSSPAIATDTSAHLLECLQNLSNQYNGNLGAFSITSAAYDLVALISQTQTNSDVVVYGLGYSTLVVERLLHFGVAEIKGYVLDSSVTTSGSNLNQFAYYSQSDADFGDVGDELLRVCENDRKCSAKFQGGGGDNKSVSETLKAVLERVDDSQCVSLWSDSSNSTWARAYPVSFNVRRTLAMLMQNTTERALIPVVIYRLHRCNTQDQVVLTNLVARLQERERELASHSELVYDLQMFSELWEVDTLLPTQSSMMSRFIETLISPGRVFDQVPTYCVFAGNTTSEACSALGSSTPGDNKSAVAPRFTYAHDQYWNAAATIPAHASVLLLSSRLNGQAPTKITKLLAEALQGSAKTLLTFEDGTHGVLTPPVQVPSDVSSSCGLEVLSLYIMNSGALGVLNTTCVEQMAPVSFTITEATSLQLLITTDAYDGSTLDYSSPSAPSYATPAVNTESTSSSPTEQQAILSLQSSRNRYRAAFIVVVCLLALILLVALAALCRWRKQRKNQELRREEDELRRMRGEATNDMELLRQIYLSSPETWSNADALFGGERWSAGSNIAQKQANAQRGSIYSDDDEDEEEMKPPVPLALRSWVYRSNHLQL